MFGTWPPCLPLLHLAVFLCNDNYRLWSEQDTRILVCLRDLCCNPGRFLLDLGFMRGYGWLCHVCHGGVPVRLVKGRWVNILSISARSISVSALIAAARLAVTEAGSAGAVPRYHRSRRPVSSIISILLLLGCLCHEKSTASARGSITATPIVSYAKNSTSCLRDWSACT